jgi:threonine/homoserine/homoserine lactone efflux protein
MIGVSLASFAAGVGVGLAVAVPIGPMGVLCIHRTLAFGLLAGFATGLGAATVHLAFGSLAALGLGATMAARVGASAQVLSLLSAGLLFWFAARIMRRTTVIGPKHPQPEKWLRFYGSALLFGLSNPVTILLFAAALPAVAARSDWETAPLLIAGIFLGSITWWICLSTTIALIRTQLSCRVIAFTNKATGMTLAALGTITAANAFGLKLS